MVSELLYLLSPRGVVEVTSTDGHILGLGHPCRTTQF
jgi:hypothetical protein